MLKKFIASCLAATLILGSMATFADETVPSQTLPITPTDSTVTTPVIPATPVTPVTPATPVTPVTPVTPAIPATTVEQTTTQVTSDDATLQQQLLLKAQIEALQKELKALQTNNNDNQKNKNNKNTKNTNNNSKLIEDKTKQIKDLQKKIQASRDQLKDETKQQNKEKYTDKELNYIKTIETALNTSNLSLKVIPLENIITDNKTFEVDAPLAVKGDIIYMPMGVLQKSFEAKITYESTQKKFIVKTADGLIEMFLNSNTIEIDGSPIKATAKPIVIKDKVMIPVNQIVKFLKINVSYDAATNTLIVDDLRIPNGQ